MAEPMVPQGFYRVHFDGCVGIGYCKHYTSEVMEETYEDWSLMYLRSDHGGFQHIYNSHINSRSESYKRLTIGKRIIGLPRTSPQTDL